MTPSGSVMIAGAGIGGLTAALAIAQRGFRVTVFDQAIHQQVESDANERLEDNEATIRRLMNTGSVDPRWVRIRRPVIVTGGERESHGGGVWHVPKQHLITGLRVMLEKRELGYPARLARARLFEQELAEMGTQRNSRGRASFGAQEGEHDDLVMASALACWRARRRSDGMWGTRSLGLV